MFPENTEHLVVPVARHILICFVYGTSVLPNSSWTSWSSYSGCSVSCGSGTSSRSRICYLPTNNLPTQGCIGNNTEVQICNEGICPKSCNVNANITCSNINQPVILDDMSQTMQDINNTMSWWSWAATTSLFKSCNPADYNSTLLKLNDYISFVTATMDNIFMNVNRTIYFIACSNNSTIQQNLLSYCETAAHQKDFLNVSLFQLQSYIKQVNSTILNCNSAVFEWTSWESWYPCSSSCNGGYTSRERYCNPVDTTNQQLHCYGTCTSCIGAFVDYKACNTQSCSNVLCDVLKNRDCSTVSKSALDLSKFLNVSSVNKVISEVLVWPFLITDELFKSCNLDTLVEQLTKLNSHMAMAYSARDNTLAHLEQVQDLIVCTTNNFVQPSLYDVCLNAAQQDIVLNAIVNQLNLYAQQYQTAIDACKSCGFACSIIESFIKVLFKSGM
ncbi:semaphorin-5A isoform X2 [Hydra vulgaris]|uniref:semaphorin-5A isoform X2 n=1 Tax=Hydra vulgaris TaxID=6087 RepID=UPI001F5F79A2|nr:semaphorin-5A isoform X2 [Hydra vulgaris]